MRLVSFLDPLLFQNSSTKIPYKSCFKICGRLARCLHGARGLRSRGGRSSTKRVYSSRQSQSLATTRLATMNSTTSMLLVAALASIVPLSGASNAEGEAYLKKNAEDSDVVVLPSGLHYKILESGPADGTSPGVSDKCSCHYRGSTIDGQEFDSSFKRNTPSTFAPKGVGTI